MIDSGAIFQGVTVGEVDEFRGIPYAGTASARWKPPEERTWTAGEVVPAVDFGKACPQLDSQGKPCDDSKCSEDCLSLNVYRPAKTEAGPHLPVMVWIHGGCGCGDGVAPSLSPPSALESGRRFDPTPLVNKRVIVVTFNYRLGVLGRFAHPLLDKEEHQLANYGLMDQQLALKWVHENIKAFGGDPAKVTIFGVSGGGISVYAHLVSPVSQDRFGAAIVQSGTVGLFQPYFMDVFSIVPLTSAEAQGLAFSKHLKCDTQSNPLACLRGMDISDLLKAQWTSTQAGVLGPHAFLYPVKDGVVLPSDAFGKGFKVTVPVISGSNHDEWRTQIALQYDFGEKKAPLTDAGYPSAVSEYFGPYKPWFPCAGALIQHLVDDLYSLDKIVLKLVPEHYHEPFLPIWVLKPPTYERAPLALAALATDHMFACPAHKAAQLLAQSSLKPVYVYEFSDQKAPSTFSTPPSFPLGATHFSEVQYLFDVDEKPASFATQGQRDLSAAMISYWTNFAKTGDPNPPGEPVSWPDYKDRDEILSLVPQPNPDIIKSDVDFVEDHQCGLWDNLETALACPSVKWRVRDKSWVGEVDGKKPVGTWPPP